MNGICPTSSSISNIISAPYFRFGKATLRSKGSLLRRFPVKSACGSLAKGLSAAEDVSLSLFFESFSPSYSGNGAGGHAADVWGWLCRGGADDVQ
jgi:hypothetical protein